MTTTASVSQTLLDTMNPKTTTKSGTSAQDIQDRFMAMLVAQMKNQDPLNPMDNAQVTSQLAQLSTVTGIETMNKTIESLSGSYQTSQNLQATSLIGHGVLTSGSHATLSGGIAGMGVNLSGSADSVVVDVYNSVGVKVNSIDLGAKNAGISSFTWDGSSSDGTTAADGDYTFKVKATSNGKDVTATTLQFGVVNSVSFGTSGSGTISLDVSNLGKINFSDVQQVL